MNRTQKRLVGAGIALAGAGAGLAIANRLLLLDDLPPTLPGAMHDWRWRGWRVRYTTMGSGSPVVLVHGIHAAASSYEMRNIFEPLSHGHTVYALDLPGFGKSERPDALYTGDLYATVLADFLAEVVGEPAAVIASSLSAAYALTVASERPELVSQLVLISPVSQTDAGPAARTIGRLLATPLLGTAMFNVLVSHASIQTFLRRVYADPACVDEPLVGQHRATAHQPNARFAPAAFVAGALDLNISGLSGLVAAPILVLRGTVPGLGTQLSDACLSSLSSRVEIQTISGAGQVPHDEAPDQVLAILEPWLRATPEH
ncbi:MAG: alpha/beta fold hydrolase [Chloroflexota bacterium]